MTMDLDRLLRKAEGDRHALKKGGASAWDWTPKSKPRKERRGGSVKKSMGVEIVDPDALVD